MNTKQEGLKVGGINTQSWAERLCAAAEQVRREARGIWRKASNEAEDVWGDSSQWVRRHPLPGVLAGAGVGILVGAALGSAWRRKAGASSSGRAPSAVPSESSGRRLLRAVGVLLRERFEPGRVAQHQP
jgi:ElaB/YqjD/DUF883 family membrane-anchored ribosome-binding protein